jgi:hypothetical protein
MVDYTLILKDESPMEDRESNVERWMHDNIHHHTYTWRIHAKLSFETVVIVSASDYIERLLARWFADSSGQTAPYPPGTLLAWSRTSERATGYSLN